MRERMEDFGLIVAGLSGYLIVYGAIRLLACGFLRQTPHSLAAEARSASRAAITACVTGSTTGAIGLAIYLGFR